MIPIDLIHSVDVDKAPDLVHRVRGLSFFKRHLAQGIVSIGRREGLPARFDETAIAPIFLDWIDAIMAQRAYAAVDRRDYIIFGAGILLKRLLETRPIRLMAAPAPVARGEVNPIASVWGEGFLATSYCLSVLDAVFEQEGLQPVLLEEAANRVDVWQSFRENVAEDPRLAIPFLDLFVGNTPNWSEPTWARNRPAQMRHGLRLLN